MIYRVGFTLDGLEYEISQVQKNAVQTRHVKSKEGTNITNRSTSSDKEDACKQRPKILHEESLSMCMHVYKLGISK